MALRSALVVGLSTGVVLLSAWWLGGPFGLGVVAVVVLVVASVAHRLGDQLVLRVMRARELPPLEAPQIHAVVAELAQRRGVRMPRLYVSPTSAPNAFTTRSGICITVGLVEQLDARELRAVLAHEVGHVGERETPLAAAVAGAGVIFGHGARDDAEPGAMGRAAGRLVELFTWAAIGQAREYRADAVAAAITGDPLTLGTALRKIEVGAAALPLGGQLAPVGALTIAAPCAGRAPRLTGHPPMAERVARLEELVSVHSGRNGDAGARGPALAAPDPSPTAT